MPDSDIPNDLTKLYNMNTNRRRIRRESDSPFESARKVHLNRLMDRDSEGHGRAMVGRKLGRAYLAEQVARIDEAAVTGGSWTMKWCELNLLARAVNER